MAAAQLPPPQRLALLAAVLGCFVVVGGGVALVLRWGSGIVRFAQVGAAIPASWLALAGIAALMTAILLLIVLRFHRPPGVLTVALAVLGT